MPLGGHCADFLTRFPHQYWGISLYMSCMGPIASVGNGIHRLATLSALISSRNSVARHSNLPIILLVAQLDPSLPGVSREIQVIRNLKPPVTSLISQNATASTVFDGLRYKQVCHFACHGVLTIGNRLTLPSYFTIKGPSCYSTFRLCGLVFQPVNVLPSQYVILRSYQMKACATRHCTFAPLRGNAIFGIPKCYRDNVGESGRLPMKMASI